MKGLLCFIGLFLVVLSIWLNLQFGSISLDQFYSVILLDTSEIWTVNPALKLSFLAYCLVLPTILTVFYLKYFSKSRYSKHMNLLLFFLGLMFINYEFDIWPYKSRFVAADFFKNNYKDPKEIKISSVAPKNLLLIYVESLETTYSNISLFHRDLLQALTHLNLPHITFPYYEQVSGTSWSIAGIIATQCGIPLKLNRSIKRQIVQNETVNVLPNTLCLGDILAAHGYKNIYMNGSLLNFSGFGPFFRDHHYSERYGREHWTRSGILNKAQMTNWGMPDDQLLMVAKLKLSQLVKLKQPFNLTLFLVDTHGVAGELSPSCKQAGHRDFSGIVECTANQLANFIKDIHQEGWLKHTNVVILGDHLAMRNTVSSHLARAKKRYIFNMIVGEQAFKSNTLRVVPFDFFPTILTALGFEVEGGRLGLGYSAIGDYKEYPPHSRIAVLKEYGLKKDPSYDKLWEVKPEQTRLSTHKHIESPKVLTP